MSASDNDRISYLSGEDVDALAPEERAELDELRNLLDDESVWTEPPPELEDRIVTAIADEARTVRTDPTPAPQPTPDATPAPPPAAQPATPKPARQRQAYKPKRRFPSILLERPIYMAGALASLVAVIALVTFFTT